MAESERLPLTTDGITRQERLAQLATIDVRINAAFSYEDISQVAKGTVVYPDQVFSSPSGETVVASGTTVYNLDSTGKVVGRS